MASEWKIYERAGVYQIGRIGWFGNIVWLDRCMIVCQYDSLDEAKEHLAFLQGKWREVGSGD